MLVSEAIPKISYAIRGIDDAAPLSGSEEYNYWVSTLNRKKNELYENIAVQWRNTWLSIAPIEPGTTATTATTTLTGTSTHFTEYEIGDKITVDGETERIIATIVSDTSLTVTAAFANTASSKTFTHRTVIQSGLQTYSLHRSFLSPSDKICVTKTNGQKVYFDVVQPQERDETKSEVYISGENPQLITFTREILADDSIVGGALNTPGFFMPDDVSDATDELPFLDPYWGVMSTASEIAFNDIIYETKAPDLNDKANSLYRQMVNRNRRGTNKNPRRVQINVNRIRGAVR